jgi:hypothetical protein
MTTLAKAERVFQELRTSTRRNQVRGIIRSLKDSPALSSPSVADSPSALEAWNRAIDLILEEKA